MIKFIKEGTTIGINLLWIITLTISARRGELTDTISMILRIWKFDLAIFLGKEGVNAKETRQKIKESKNTYASA